MPEEREGCGNRICMGDAPLREKCIRMLGADSQQMKRHKKKTISKPI
jgi:hypothetical protein